MTKASRLHNADEFGKQGSSSLTGLDAPHIGAAASILVDGIVERESGKTPGPPLVSVRAVLITLLVMLLLGFALFTWLSRQPAPEWITGAAHPWWAPSE